MFVCHTYVWIDKQKCVCYSGTVPYLRVHSSEMIYPKNKSTTIDSILFVLTYYCRLLIVCRFVEGWVSKKFHFGVGD